MSFRDVAITLVVAALIALLLLRPLYRHWLRLRRAEFIRTYAWPRGLLERLEKHHSGMERKDSALVSRGLRQFFVAYLMSGKRFVSMPSQVADDLWHEFILYTREYEIFCRRAFGTFLHHTPAAVLGAERRNNEGLRRVWWYCCKYENISPFRPTRMPLLFALDAKLNSGRVYLSSAMRSLAVRRRHRGDLLRWRFCQRFLRWRYGRFGRRQRRRFRR
jgi:hypothetical protein